MGYEKIMAIFGWIILLLLTLYVGLGGGLAIWITSVLSGSSGWQMKLVTLFWMVVTIALGYCSYEYAPFTLIVK